MVGCLNERKSSLLIRYSYKFQNLLRGKLLARFKKELSEVFDLKMRFVIVLMLVQIAIFLLAVFQCYY